MSAALSSTAVGATRRSGPLDRFPRSTRITEGAAVVVSKPQTDNPGVRLYGDLAPWFHLLTSPSDYDVESAR